MNCFVSNVSIIPSVMTREKAIKQNCTMCLFNLITSSQLEFKESLSSLLKKVKYSLVTNDRKESLQVFKQNEVTEPICFVY